MIEYPIHDCSRERGYPVDPMILKVTFRSHESKTSGRIKTY